MWDLIVSVPDHCSSFYLEYKSNARNMSHVTRKSINVICEQHRRRSACASAQSGQRLCCSLSR